MILNIITSKDIFSGIDLISAEVILLRGIIIIIIIIIRFYCENTLIYNNGVLSQMEPKSRSVKARQLIYRFSTNTIKLRVKKKTQKKHKKKLEIRVGTLDFYLALLILWPCL